MSAVSDREGRRFLAGQRADRTALTGTPPAITLAHLARGQRARVTGYRDDVAASTARRLFDLGLVPGVEVTMIRRAPLGDPAVFRVGECEIALRNAQARCIQVEAVS